MRWKQSREMKRNERWIAKISCFGDEQLRINLVTEKDQKTLRYLPHLASLFVSQHSSIFFTHCVFFSYALFTKSNVTTHPSGVSEDSVYIENLYQYGEKLNRAKNKSQLIAAEKLERDPIKTLAEVVGSKEAMMMKICSIST
ncbi:hypothetical protein P8452_61391 [Trifolium repens]|nr:hypothetical protein P8452_61391 [Trifolium repens]